MSSLSSISLSGMNAAQAALSASAQNIASAVVPGAPRAETQSMEMPGGGVQTMTTTAAAVQDALANDMIRQLQARNAFLANLVMFRRGDAVAGALLSLRA